MGKADWPTQLFTITWYAANVYLQRNSLTSDAPEVAINTSQPTATDQGWLNCSVSSNPVSNITWYKVTPNPTIIQEDLFREHNSLNYRVTPGGHAYDDVYRCTADNGLGVVVNSELHFVTLCKPFCLKSTIVVFVFGVMLLHECYFMNINKNGAYVRQASSLVLQVRLYCFMCTYNKCSTIL